MTAKKRSMEHGGNELLGIAGMGLLIWGLTKRTSTSGGDENGGGGGNATVPTPETIESLTTREELDSARNAFEAAYSEGIITRERYDVLYLAYVRRGYWVDLYQRGGQWVTAAAEYWASTAGITDAERIYQIYVNTYNKFVSGGTSSEKPAIQVIEAYWGSTAGEKRMHIGLLRAPGETLQSWPYVIRVRYRNPGTEYHGYTIDGMIGPKVVGSSVGGADGGMETDTYIALAIPTTIGDGTYTVGIRVSSWYKSELLTLSYPTISLPTLAITTQSPQSPPSGEPSTVPQQLASIWSYVGDGNNTSRKVVWARRNGVWYLYDSQAPQATDLIRLQSGDVWSVWVSQSCTLTYPQGGNRQMSKGWNTDMIWP